MTLSQPRRATKLLVWQKILAIALSLHLAVPTPVAAQTNTIELPSIGNAGGSTLSLYEEERLGAAFMRALRKHLSFIDDPEVQDYIDALGYRLVSQLNNNSQNYSFFAVNNPSINAFAGPGGYVGIHTGTIINAETEGELASVVAHEIAHVSQRHLARAFEQQNKLALPTAAAMIAAIVLGTQNSQLGQAAIASTIAGSQQTQLNFSRSHEQEADRIGMQLLADSGFDPYSMPAFFEKLLRSTRYYDNVVPEFLHTHPVTISRIADTRSRAEQYEQRNISDNLSFYLIQAKLKVITSTNLEQTSQQYASTLVNGRVQSEEATRYGLALSLLKLGKYGDAETEINTLLKKDPNRFSYLLLAAELASAQKKHDAALKIYQNGLALYPRNNALTIAYASALLENNNPTQAQNILLDYLRYRAPSPLIFKLLARADGEAGRNIEVHQSLAEYEYLNGNTISAIEHLEFALKQVKEGDNYRSSRIAARLKELKNEATEEGVVK